MALAAKLGITPFTVYFIKRLGIIWALSFLVWTQAPFGQLTGVVDSFLIRQWFSLRGPRPVPQSVVVVRIDTRSLRRLKVPLQHPIPLSAIAAVLERAGSAGAKLVVLDLFLEGASSDDAANERLRNALAQSPSVIGRAEHDYIDVDLDGSRAYSIDRLEPDAVFGEAAKAVVRMMVRMHDNVVTRIALSDNMMPRVVEKMPLLGPLRQFVSEGAEQPGDYDLINYYGDSYSLADVPLYRLVTDEDPVPDDFFKDKVVFLGGVDLPNRKFGKDDTFSVPSSPNLMWGVEIHATIAANLLDGSWIRRLPPQREEEIGVCVFIVLGFIILLLGFYRGVLLAAASTAAWSAASYYLFAYGWLFIPGVRVFGVALPILVLGMSASALVQLRKTVREFQVMGRSPLKMELDRQAD